MTTGRLQSRSSPVCTDLVAMQALRAQRLRDATAEAGHNPNRCVRCSNILYAAVKDNQWTNLVPCRHLLDKDRKMQVSAPS